MVDQFSKKLLNAWQIKLILVFLMMLNHLEYVYGLCPENIAHLFQFISRGVAPMFAYLAVEGIIHSSSLKNYCLRLWIWSGLVYLGNILIEHVLIKFSYGIPLEDQLYLLVRTNICFTLSAGVLCIALLKFGNQSEGIKKYLLLGLSAVSFTFGFFQEWGVVLLLFMLVTYQFRKNNKYKLIGYLSIEVVAFLFRSEIFYFLVFPFIVVYNGKRGPNSKLNKYFFYVFYPLHLWLIAIINYIVLTNK